MSDKHIIAAGAVVTRDNSGEKEFLLIHRGYRDDWSFPKGKLDPGEHLVGAAIREVREETGFAIQLGIPLPTAHYTKNNATKDAYYWNAQLLGGEFVPNDEVDQIKWLPLKKAKDLLTYEHDKEMIEIAAQSVQTSPFIVMRHTQAIKRAEWIVSKDGLAEVDASRPLTAVGRMQAGVLVPALAAFGINQLHTSDSRRCRDTVGPYASARSIAIHLEPTLSEERHKENPKKAQTRVAQLATTDEAVALCTHRPVMPTVMQSLTETFEVENPSKKTFDSSLTPGSMVIFHRDAKNLGKVHHVERHIH
ncbi:MAG: hypothetical protein RLZZ571_949 [Actinomycetota bacterium]